jgi:hypothetical protein
MPLSLEQINTIRHGLSNARNARTAIEQHGRKSTQYLVDNDGYAKIVGVRFKDNPKVYDYLDLDGTVRTGDNPKVEVTNIWTGQNHTVPGKYTKVVSTGKGGIMRNRSRLDMITQQGINLKIIDPKLLK